MVAIPWFVEDTHAPHGSFTMPPGIPGQQVWPAVLQWAYDGSSYVWFDVFIQDTQGGWHLFGDATTGSQQLNIQDFISLFSRPDFATFVQGYIGDPVAPKPGSINRIQKDFYEAHMTPAPGPAPVITPGTAPPAGTTVAQMVAAMNASAPLGAAVKLTLNAAGVPVWK